MLGVLLGIARSEMRLLLFLISPGLSHAIVVIPGLFAQPLTSQQAVPILLLFLAVQLAICVGLTFYIRPARVAATLLSAFCISYALVAAFIGGMALTHNWI